MTNNNTICAVATATGGAIGIIRVSGDEAIEITSRIFKPANSSKTLLDCKPYTLTFGNIINGSNEVVDEVLVSVFHMPHSYTGENSVEISCHGSEYILRQVMKLLLENGCRTAEPGEFTKRAFLNGKMDLSQAEAVADLIASSNKATHDMALSQLRGHFSNELSALRAQLLKLTSLLELELDFSDHEELEFANRSELHNLAAHIQERVRTLALSFETGNALKNGIPVAIVGNTNVGKSTLLNRLLHEDKAIVSDIHGTTRDYIEDTTELNGITFRFVDTAGIRKTDDVVESIGIERTFQKMDEARIVLWLIDNQPTKADIENIERHITNKKLIVVRNKMDMTELSGSESYDYENLSNIVGDCKFISISAKQGTNITELENLIVKVADIPQLSESDVVVTSARHYNALLRANVSLTRVIESLQLGLSGDLIAEDLHEVLDSLSDITGDGRISSQETLNNIFKNFCIGK